MAEHKVQLPDNSIITIEGPDDATDQELIDAASKHYSSKQSKPAASVESQPVTAPTVQSVTESARNMDPMTYGAGAAAGVGVLAGAKLLKDKFFGVEKPKQSIERIEPQMDISQKKPSEPFLEPETQTVRPTDWESSLSAEDRQLLERSRANAAVKAAQPAPVTTPAGGNVVPQAQIPAAAQPAPVVPPAPVVEAPVNPKLPALLQPPAGAAPPPVVAPAIAEPVASPVLPTTPIKTDNPLITAAQAAPVAPAPAEEPAVKATNKKVLETIKSTAQTSLGKPDLVTGTGMPAYQGQGPEGSKPTHKKGVFESIKQIPKEYVFVPTGQNMDIVRNAVGQPEYTKNLKSSGGYPESAQAAYEQSRNINKSLGRATMAEAKASGVALPEPTPSITQKISGNKTVRVAGVTGALILATDLASAATTGESPLANMVQGFKEAVKNKDYGMAASQAAELLNFHPYTLLANQLFGSSPEELKILREADQARKAKAGNAATSKR